MARLLFVVNDAAFFHRHRGMLARAARDSGYEVHVATPPGPGAERIVNDGFAYHALSFAPTGRNPFAELLTILRFVLLFRQVRPDVVHLVTIKPVLYGGLASRIARVPATVFAIPGLGYVFLATGLWARLQRAFVLLAYRAAFGHPNSRAIFQNSHDRNLFIEAGLIDTPRTVVIPGSGIDLSEFTVRPLPLGTPIVVLPARMLWDKGVGEFVSAARLLKSRGCEARFALVGPADSPNPAAVPEARLREWEREGIIEWWGMQEDMASVYARSSIVCLPSYREGIPRALIEAAACGRAVVTTDAPGCRDVARPENGVLAKVRDARSLADALAPLLADEGKRCTMGQAGRRLVEADLAPERVVGLALDVYASLTTEHFPVEFTTT